MIQKYRLCSSMHQNYVISARRFATRTLSPKKEGRGGGELYSLGLRIDAAYWVARMETTKEAMGGCACRRARKNGRRFRWTSIGLSDASGLKLG